MNRLSLAFRAFWSCLRKPDQADRIAAALVAEPEGPDLRILALLQRDGRLVDFLQEEIDSYGDAQIGAAVRDIHKGCRKAIQDYIALEPIFAEEEGATVKVEEGFDPAAIRLTGNLTGSPPFRGILKHHGWRVRSLRLPNLPIGKSSGTVVAPAEVEIA